MIARRETYEQREHRYDREYAAAFWRWRRARKRTDSPFQLPPSLRKAKP